MIAAADPRRRPTRYQRLRRNLVLSFALTGAVMIGFVAWSIANDARRLSGDAGAQIPVPNQVSLESWRTETLAKCAFALLAALGIAGLLAVSLRQIRRLEVSEADLVFSKFSIDRSAEMVMWLERDGRFYYVNNALCERSGYRKEELLARTIFDLCPDIDPGSWERRVRELGELGSRRLTQEIVTRFGDTFTVDAVASIVEYSGRSLICANARDETAQRTAEAALRESESRYRSTVDSLHEGILVRDRDRILACNPSAERIFGLPADSIIDRLALSPLITFYDSNGALVEAGAGPAFRALNTGQPQYGHTYRVQRTDGSSLWVEANATPLFGAGEELSNRVVTTYADITTRREAETALRASEEKFARVFDLMPELVTVTDVGTGQYVEMNEAWTPLTGFTRAEAVGRSSAQLNIWVSRDDRQRLVDDVIAHGEVRDREIAFRRKNGSVFYSNVSACIFEVQGRRLLMLIVRDVTVQRRAEEQRRAAEERVRRLNEELEGRVAKRTRELEIANKELEAFSYSVSHDLRAPLRAIEGFSALLAQSMSAAADNKAEEYLPRIRSAALRMGHLIDDMLNLSRIGRHQLSRRQFDMVHLVREVCEEIRGTDPARSVCFEVEGDLRVDGDASLLRIVLTNLIGNAWKFSAPKPDARIGVRGERDDQSVHIKVSDNGVGFDPTYSARLFGAFQRLHNESEFAGSGIGLAIVQRIVHRHGGEITASGKPGEGATFVVKLPLGRQVNREPRH